MTLPKGFGSGGAGGSSSADVERMIGRRVENMTGMITISFIAAWLATFGGTAAGYFYYPWAYPTPSGHFAFIVLTIIEAIGYIFCVKVMEEGSNKNSNGIVAGVVGAVTIGTIDSIIRWKIDKTTSDYFFLILIFIQKCRSSSHSKILYTDLFLNFIWSG